MTQHARKVTLNTFADGRSCCVSTPESVGKDDEWTANACRALFGSIPPTGESRDYYIVPAGRAVEFEVQVDQYAFYIQSGEATWEIESDIAEDIFGLDMNKDETRRVTCIIHDAEKQPEPPPKLRQCWFRINGRDYHGVQIPGGSIKVHPQFEFPGNNKFGTVDICPVSDFEDEGIELHWYED